MPIAVLFSVSKAWMMHTIEWLHMTRPGQMLSLRAEGCRISLRHVSQTATPAKFCPHLDKFCPGANLGPSVSIQDLPTFCLDLDDCVYCIRILLGQGGIESGPVWVGFCVIIEHLLQKPIYPFVSLLRVVVSPPTPQWPWCSPL